MASSPLLIFISRNWGGRKVAGVAQSCPGHSLAVPPVPQNLFCPAALVPALRVCLSCPEGTVHQVARCAARETAEVVPGWWDEKQTRPGVIRPRISQAFLRSGDKSLRGGSWRTQSRTLAGTVSFAFFHLCACGGGIPTLLRQARAKS